MPLYPGGQTNLGIGGVLGNVGRENVGDGFAAPLGRRGDERRQEGMLVEKRVLKPLP